MIDGIDHISIAVKDVEEAAKFLEKGFGLKIEHTEEIAEQGVKVAFVDIGGVSVELVQPLDENSVLNKFIEKRGPGLHHIAFKVDNISAALNKLEKDEIRLIDKEPRHGAHDKKIAFIHPANAVGTLIELCEEKLRRR